MGPPREIDNAVFGDSLLGGSGEPTYSGVLSFMRRRLTRDLTGVDVAVWGIPFDAAVSNRPGQPGTALALIDGLNDVERVTAEVMAALPQRPHVMRLLLELRL